MAVIIKYIVVRNGVEKMTFLTRKEADAYDKMLDIADNLFEFISASEIEIEEKSIEDIAFYLAENKDKVIPILKGSKPTVKKTASAKTENNPDGKQEKSKNPPAGSREKKKK